MLRALEHYLTFDLSANMQVTVIVYGKVPCEVVLHRIPAHDGSVKKAISTLINNADMETQQNSTLEEALRIALRVSSLVVEPSIVKFSTVFH